MRRLTAAEREGLRLAEQRPRRRELVATIAVVLAIAVLGLAWP